MPGIESKGRRGPPWAAIDPGVFKPRLLYVSTTRSKISTDFRYVGRLSAPRGMVYPGVDDMGGRATGPLERATTTVAGAVGFVVTLYAVWTIYVAFVGGNLPLSHWRLSDGGLLPGVVALVVTPAIVASVTGIAFMLVGGLVAVIITAVRAHPRVATGLLVVALVAAGIGSYAGVTGSDRSTTRPASAPVSAPASPLPVVSPLAVPAATASSASPGDGAVTAATLLQQCEKAHGLSEAKVHRHTASEDLFLSCSWPPAPGADSDGYRRIAVTYGSTSEPESSDASGYDLISGDCKTYELTYSFGAQGDHALLPTFEVDEGVVTQQDAPGKPFSITGVQLGGVPYPGPGEVVYLRNGNESIASVACK